MLCYHDAPPITLLAIWREREGLYLFAARTPRLMAEPD